MEVAVWVWAQLGAAAEELEELEKLEELEE